MALFKKRNGDPVGAAESKVQELRQRGEALQAQHGRVAAKLQAALKERDGAVLDDGALEVAGLSVASVEAQLKGIDLAISENQRALAEAESALAVAVDRRDREAKAAKLDQLADQFESAARDYAASVTKLRDIHAELEKIAPVDALVVPAQFVGSAMLATEAGAAFALSDIHSAAARLRADPPPQPAPVTPPPIGELSGVKRKFTTLSSPGAVGDRAPPEYFGGFAEIER